MRKITNILLVVLLTRSVCFAQTELFNVIKESFSSGNVLALSENFDNNINCNILGKENFYSRSQSTIIFKDFFATYKPKDFKIQHHKIEKNGIIYLIGEYTTQGGDAFRVIISIKQESETELYIIKIKLELKSKQKT